jgi:predicted transcriptional regulator
MPKTRRAKAIEAYAAHQVKMLAELREANHQVKSGHYIRHEEMKAWLLSWGMDDELPLPKCVCGARHGDDPPCRD